MFVDFGVYIGETKPILGLIVKFKNAYNIIMIIIYLYLYFKFNICKEWKNKFNFFTRLEKLQKSVEKFNRESKICDGKLDDLERKIKDVSLY